MYRSRFVIEPVVVIDELEIDGDASLNLRIRELVDDSFPIDLVGELYSELGQVVLAVGVLDVGEKISTLSDEVAAAAKKIPGGPHLRGINIGHRDHAASEKPSDLSGVDPIVFGLPSGASIKEAKAFWFFWLGAIKSSHGIERGRGGEGPAPKIQAA